MRQGATYGPPGSTRHPQRHSLMVGFDFAIHSMIRTGVMLSLPVFPTEIQVGRILKNLPLGRGVVGISCTSRSPAVVLGTTSTGVGLGCVSCQTWTHFGDHTQASLHCVLPFRRLGIRKSQNWWLDLVMERFHAAQGTTLSVRKR